MATEPPEPDPITDAVPPEVPEAEEAELDEAARVTESDLDDAADAWRRYAPPKYRDLLDAD